MGSLPKTKKKKIPKSIHEMSKEALQETLKKKKECNAKALETVERLCEPNVDEEWFLSNLKYINQCHFDDATIERSITKVCGYPLCDEKLDKIPGQQYRISTRYNKVFDITERKNFCSSSCYKSAMHVKKQLFTSPLWFRDQEVIPTYTVLKSMKSSLGEEVVLLPDKIKLEDVILESNKKTSNVVKNTKSKENHSGERIINLDKNFDESENKSSDASATVMKVNNLDENVYDLTKKCSDLKLNDSKIDKVETKVIEDVHPKERNKELLSETILERKSNVTYDNTSIKKPCKSSESHKSQETKKENTKGKPVGIIQKIENCIFEWFSLDTLFYLYGEEKLKELFKDKATAIKEVINSKLSLAGQSEKINKMIQLYGLLDSDSFSSGEVKTNLKPLPDYSILKEEGKNLEIKVKAFYQGQLQIMKPEVEEKEEDVKQSADSEPIYLPLIDAHAQTALRRKIVLDKLNKVLPELMKVINSDFALQRSEIRNLVSTFTLSAHNITFKPAEWCFVGIILIKLLGEKDKILASALSQESSKNQMLVILMSYELEKDYLDNLVHRLTNSENLVEKLNDINR